MEPDEAGPRVTYDPSRFTIRTANEAAAIILTPESSTTEARWRTETPYLLHLIEEHCRIGADSVVLDYGCGIGRLSRELIQRHGCRVVGADISPSMRAHAEFYVNSPRFVCCAPEALDWLPIEFDVALAVWVLQHCENPAADIGRIKSRLAARAPVFVANNDYRAVPTLEFPWWNDGIDIAALLDGSFEPLERWRLSPKIIPASLAQITYWGMWRRPEAP